MFILCSLGIPESWMPIDFIVSSILEFFHEIYDPARHASGANVFADIQIRLPYAVV